MMEKNIWIFGGTGFVGKAVVQHLPENPEYRLNLLIHHNTEYKNLEPYNTFTGSLTNFDLSWLEKYPPNIIIHLARLGGRNKPIRYYRSLQAAKANQRIIDFLSKTNISPVIVYVSSLLMYGNQPENVFAFENSILNPLSYAKQFIIGEQPWLDVQLTKKLDVRFARPGWIIGPDSWFKAFYWNYFCVTGKVPMYGSGSQLMSMIYVDDLAGQIVNLAENGIKSQNLNMYTGEPITQQEFVEMLARQLNANIDVISNKVLKQKFGVAVSEPIISSVPLNTIYKDLQNLYVPQFSSVESMIEHTISILQRK